MGRSESSVAPAVEVSGPSYPVGKVSTPSYPSVVDANVSLFVALVVALVVVTFGPDPLYVNTRQTVNKVDKSEEQIAKTIGGLVCLAVHSGLPVPQQI